MKKMRILKFLKKDILIFITGLALVSYPVISNYIESIEQADQIDTYNSSVSELSRANKQLMLNEAHEWNDNLYSKEKGLPEDSGLEYENVLDLGNGVIGTVEIPKIKVNMPVYHGTESNVLNVGAGHIEDSSLPVGGNNTHTVLTGHRGLPSSKLFTRLDELKKGDLFFIKVLDETLAYKINKIEVVLPDKVSYSIIDNQDLATLITCTPYGLNTNRLVITGKRVPYEEKEKKSIKSSMPSLREIIFYVIPVLFSVAGILFFRKRGVKMCKKLITAVFTVFLFFISITAVSALDEVGSITVNLEEGKKGTSVKNVELELIKVGDVVNGQYLFIDDLQDIEIDLNTLETAEDMKNAAYTISKITVSKNIVGTRKTTNDYGTVKFYQLEKGVYLLQATDINKYENIVSTLISVPAFNNESKNSMNYDISIVPKHSPVIAVKTGDAVDLKLFAVLAGVSAVIIAIIRREAI